MTLSQSALTALALTALAFALFALAIALGLGRRLREVRRSSSMRRQEKPPNGLRETLGADISALEEALVRSIQNVGLVRFDAFEDMGGKLSFSIALLDADGNGVVLTSINGRNETRIYAKPVERGASRIQLAEEEVEAIRRALGTRV